MPRFILTDAAEQDLQDIKDYIAEDSVRIARRVVRDLRHAMRRLAEMPGMGHVREDLTDEGVRFWVVYSYYVIYRPETKPLEIVRVVSSWRDIRSILAC